ncbi:hypothetical protein O9993_00115 [Vibrio lentus]|nr:hypothetical protein [Vibrio lentus]
MGRDRALYQLPLPFRIKPGCQGKASALLSFIGVLLLLIPLVALSSEYLLAHPFDSRATNGTLSLPKPKESLQDIPLIGERSQPQLFWFGCLEQYRGVFISMLKNSRYSLQSGLGLGSLGGGFIQFIISTIYCWRVHE